MWLSSLLVLKASAAQNLESLVIAVWFFTTIILFDRHKLEAVIYIEQLR
jgi:hypothetical protein